MVDRISTNITTDIIAYHGWGYDSSCWQAWAAAIAPAGARFQAFDRGYFGAAHTPQFAPAATTKIILAHSYGLHLCPPAQLAQADILILLSSFLTFHPAADRAQQRSQQILAQMALQFAAQPERVLRSFREKCADPIAAVPAFDRALLSADLQRLGTSAIDPDRLTPIPQVLILHGAGDRIVAPAQGKRLHERLPHSRYCSVPNAGHALPFTHLPACLSCLRADGAIAPFTHKPSIAARFGRSTATYHAEAELQKACADRLLTLLDRRSIPAGTVLEIGCGTGFITQKLVDRFADRALHITDLSTEMLAFCRANLDLSRFKGAIEFEPLDGERLAAQQRYALIVAGFVVQWFQQPTQSLQRLLQQLEPDGWLLVSFPSRDSFAEWKAICDRLQLPFTANSLPDPQMLQQLDAAHCWTEAETIAAQFPDAAAFFRSLKAIGAGFSTSGKQLSPSQMRRLIQAWNRQREGAIDVHYHVVYGLIQRS